MEEKEMRKFSLINLLLVTGVCSLAFTAIMKVLEGSTIRIFLVAGTASLGMGIIGLLGRLLLKKWDEAGSSMNHQDNQVS